MNSPRQEREYDLMLLLERLESLREDMVDLGVLNLEQVDRRIQDLHSRLDEPDQVASTVTLEPTEEAEPHAASA